MNDIRIFPFNEETGGRIEFFPIDSIPALQKYFKQYELETLQGKGHHNPLKREGKNSILLRSISFEEFRKLIEQYLPAYDEVRFIDISPDEPEDDIFAFGNDDIACFGGWDDKKTKLEWLELNIFHIGDYSNKYIEFLHQLGELYTLVIVDWHDRKIVDIRSLSATEAYLQEFKKN